MKSGVEVLRRLRVVLVDDDQDFREFVSRVVEKEPSLHNSIDIRFLEDGADVIQEFSSEGAAQLEIGTLPDLFIIDQRMPRLDGIDTIRVLKGRNYLRRIPMCLLSSSNHPDLLEAAYDAGANFCMEKPMDLDGLRKSLLAMSDFFQIVVKLPTRPAEGLGELS